MEKMGKPTDELVKMCQAFLQAQADMLSEELD